MSLLISTKFLTSVEAIVAARSLGNPYTPVLIFGKAIDEMLFSTASDKLFR